MPALYSHTTRATGTVLTASIYNTDHQNHITNGIPAMLDDYSTNVTAMQTATDPGEVGTESLATSLAGELERLRFAIKEVKERINGASIAQWYVTVTGDLQVADGGTGSSTAAGARTNLGIVLDVTSGTLPVASGGTGASVASSARTNLGIVLDVTSATLAVASGGTGASSAASARTNLGITLNVGSAQLPVADGGTGSSTASGARTNLGILLDVTAATLPIVSGGTGQASATAGFNALSPSTTKGDIIVNDGTNDVRLAVGTDGQLLTANSAQTNGLHWATLTQDRAITGVTAITVTTAVTNADRGMLYEYAGSGTVNLNLDAYASLDANFYFFAVMRGTGTLGIDPNAAEVIKGPGLANAGETLFTMPNSDTMQLNRTAVMVYKSAESGVFRIVNMAESHGFKKITATGSWVAPAGVYNVYLTMIAGGGGGGGSTNGHTIGGQGGSSGEFLLRFAKTVVPGTSYSATIGAAGAGGAAGAAGGNGGDTLFDGTTVSGGVGGAASTTGALSPPAGTFGYSMVPGEPKEGGTFGGNGASAGMFGNGGIGGVAVDGADADPNSGCGGGGAGIHASVTKTGGDGGSGFILIEW